MGNIDPQVKMNGGEKAADFPVGPSLHFIALIHKPWTGVILLLRSTSRWIFPFFFLKKRLISLLESPWPAPEWLITLADKTNQCQIKWKQLIRQTAWEGFGHWILYSLFILPSSTKSYWSYTCWSPNCYHRSSKNAHPPTTSRIMFPFL